MSIVEELQELAQDGSTSITELLRRAKVVAAKLKLKAVAAWVDKELNGYTVEKELPAYRRVMCELMHDTTRGQRPVPIGGEGKNGDFLREHFSTVKLHQSAAEIAALITGNKSGTLRSAINHLEMKLLNDMTHGEASQYQIFRRFPRDSLVGVEDAIRTRILDWALELEAKGILGEGMKFSTKDEKAAQTMTFNIQGDNNTISSAVGSPGAQVAAGGAGAQVGQQLTSSIERVRAADPSTADALAELAKAIASSALAGPQKAEATEHLTALAEQAALPIAERKSTVIKVVATALRGLLGVSADLIGVWDKCAPLIAAFLSVKF